MSEYTPGPWTIEEYGDDDCPALVIHKDTENRVCFMATPGSHGDPAKIEADARLIVAAPAMYKALSEISKHYANQDMNHVDFRVMAKQLADAALSPTQSDKP